MNTLSAMQMQRGERQNEVLDEVVAAANSLIAKGKISLEQTGTFSEISGAVKYF